MSNTKVKKKKEIIEHNGWILDSQNEHGFCHWLDEAKEHGFIDDYDYHTKSFELFDGATYEYERITQLKTKIKKQTITKRLLQPHVYTPDFIITPSTSFYKLNLGMSVPPFLLDKPFYVDTKGTYSKRADLVTFPIDQKWVYNKYGIFVVKIVPEKIYMKTWVPDEERYTKVRKDVVKKYEKALTLTQFLEKVL